MQIESILIRKDGTKAEIDNIEYHFAPLPDGAHVAEVERDDHIQRFLSITEGYRIYRPVAAAEPVQAPKGKKGAKAAAEPALIGSSVHDASYEINGKTYQLGDVVKQAQEKSDLSVEEWNALPDEDRHARIDMALDDIAEGK